MASPHGLRQSVLLGVGQSAGVLALAWGGLLRIGEVFQATRGHLVLPQDVARHQVARVDQPDLPPDDEEKAVLKALTINLKELDLGSLRAEATFCRLQKIPNWCVAENIGWFLEPLEFWVTYSWKIGRITAIVALASL